MSMVARIAVRASVWATAFPALLLVPATAALAGGGPENMAVVVNADSWASLAVANEYIHLRNIPAGNVVYLDNVSDFEQISVDAFRRQILKPVLEAIEGRGLVPQIDYVVYSSDLPYIIDLRQEIGNRSLPKVFTPFGSINGLTYLYGGVLAEDLGVLNLRVNRYMRRPLPEVREIEFTDEERRQLETAAGHARLGRWGDAAETFENLAKQHPDSPELPYRLAGMRARQGRMHEALSALERAVEAGWLDTRYTQADPSLAGLHRDARFDQLIDKMKQSVFDVQPTHGFRNSYGWNERGEIVESGGQHYLLSTMLAVTSGRGNSVGEAIESLRRSVGADGTRPRGAIYYMAGDGGDVRTRAREPAFAAAVAKLRTLGVRAEIQNKILPHGRHDVMGLMTGAANFKWQFSSNTIQPGAICENFTSTGGFLRPGGDQTPLTHLLRYGAAGSSGTVFEPYSIAEKFPHPFLHVHYARGCSLAEAFYQSVHGPYQLLIVGDPLCRPWARIPEIHVGRRLAGDTDEGRFLLVPTVENDQGIEIARYELFLNGQRRALCRPGQSFNVDTREFPDGFHEVRLVAVAADDIETQAGAVSGFVVDHHGHKITLEPATTTIAWDQPLRLNASLAGATRISLFENQRELAAIDGERGRFEIDPRQIGLGPVRLQARGEVDGMSVMSEPVEVRVVASRPLPAIAADSARLVEGLLLEPADAEPVAITRTRPRRWLARAGVTPGQAFELTGVFDVPEDGVYQFQVLTDGPVTIEVDETRLESPKPKRWAFLPVVLAKGNHQVHLEGKAGANQQLEVRFGGPGSMPVGAPRFKHMAR